MWNTLPAHTHDRRTEATSTSTWRPRRGSSTSWDTRPRPGTSIVADQQAIISPSWSVHSGVGSASYSFVWAMAGENQSFDDMDGFAIADMR